MASLTRPYITRFLRVSRSNILQDFSDSNMARKAVKIIANYRQSKPLRGWIIDGRFSADDEEEEELNKACKHLGWPFNPAADETTLSYHFELAKQDNPGPETDRAIEVALNAYQKKRKHVKHAPDEWPAGYTPETWPVGLLSLGNTCYLNSLLQYYFSIKPLRDLVLNFDQHKFDFAVHKTKSEHIQGIPLSRFEIEKFQEMGDHLQLLFQSMVKTKGPTAAPTKALASSVFITPDRTGATKGLEQGLGAVESVDAEMDGAGSDKSAEAVDSGLPLTSSRASSETLIDEDQTDGKPEVTLITPPESPKLGSSGPLEPQKKPPLPPRPNPERTKTDFEKAQEAATQQHDVGEIMEEILRRLRASIKPLGRNSKGEQLDQLRA